MGTTTYIIILAALSQLCGGYRILVAFPFPSRSHAILGEGYVRHLLEAGHEVTYITPFLLKNSNPKLHQVYVSEKIDALERDMWSMKEVIDKKNEVDLKAFHTRLQEFTKASLKNPEVQALLNDPEQTFDLLIIQWLLNEVYAGLASVFNCPFIWSSSVEAHAMVLRLVHEGSNPAYITDIFSNDIAPLNFVQRVKGLFRQIYAVGLRHFSILPQGRNIYEEIFGPIVTKKGRELPPYEDALHNASLVFCNSHAALGQPISQPPNIIEIGGYHIDTNIKPLPQDLQKIMDEAVHGVIYFSLGTNVKSKDFPDVLKRDILKMFSELKQTVIWKFEEDLLDKPNNVHVVKWAPQPSILAHPNCRLFITHGGLLSTTETVYFGVPTLVMPTATDQYVNAARAVHKGYALKVDMSYKMAGEMKIAIEEMLNNSKYRARIKELSEIFHDRLVPPGRELVHWVEHVARTRGAPHLRSPALLLPWYQKMYLDLAALILAVLYSIKLTFKIIIKSLRKKKTKED